MPHEYTREKAPHRLLPNVMLHRQLLPKNCIQDNLYLSLALVTLSSPNDKIVWR